MASRLTLQVVLGTSRDFLLQVGSDTYLPWSDTNPSPFLSTDILSATVSAGQDQPVLLTLFPTWVDPAAATYMVSLDDADTAALKPALFQIQVTATRAGRTAVIANAQLEVQPSAGAAAAIPIYGTFQDMLLYASWIQAIQSENDLAGFLGHRGRARTWLDDALVDRFKIRSVGMQLGDPGSGAFFMGFPLDTQPTKWFRGILAENTGVGGSSALIVTGTVKEAVSKMAIHYVLADQVTRDPESPYIKLAGGFARAAVSCLKSLRAEVDINGDGYGEYIVNMGATDLR
jgi:hypothetical protein